MHIVFDLWIGHTGIGFTITIWEKMVYGLRDIETELMILGFEGQIKLLGYELLRWCKEWIK